MKGTLNSRVLLESKRGNHHRCDSGSLSALLVDLQLMASHFH